MTDTPLIYTSRGNLPVADLTYSVRWENTDDYTKLIEIYTAADGEVVKESAHVLSKRGISSDAVQQTL